jgi:C4-dicarboxylate-binding protein DctP
MALHLVAAAFTAFSLLPGAGLAADVTMRISHPVPVAHHLHKALDGFKAEVETSTQGKVEVRIFPSEQLAKAGENHPSVARGAFEAALVTNFQWGNTVPEMNVTTIPYLFTDLDRIKKFPGSDAARILEQKLEQKGVKNIGWFYITRQSIFTSGKKPLVQLTDFKGQKIRGLSTIADAGLAAIGAAPTPMAAPEVYQALESGVLDAGITDISAAVSRKFYEVQKFGTVAPYFSVYFHMFVNPAWWNKLQPAHRAAIEAAARKTEHDMVALTEATAAAAAKQLRERGMTIHDQTPAEQKAWEAAMRQPVIDAFVKATGEDGKKLIELLNRL